MVHTFVSSNKLTTEASATSCKVSRAVPWKHRLPLCCAISHIHLTNGNLWMRNPVGVWNFWIWHRATVPGLNLLFFLMESVDGFWYPVSSPPSLFFGFLSLLSPALSTSFPSSYPRCIFFIYVLDNSDHSATFSLSSQITTILNLNWVKDVLSWDFVKCYIFMM